MPCLKFRCNGRAEKNEREDPADERLDDIYT
jgi:hypothetical protein